MHDMMTMLTLSFLYKLKRGFSNSWFFKNDLALCFTIILKYVVWAHRCAHLVRGHTIEVWIPPRIVVVCNRQSSNSPSHMQNSSQNLRFANTIPLGKYSKNIIQTISITIWCGNMQRNFLVKFSPILMHLPFTLVIKCK